MTATTNLAHADFCLPRPGEDAPRIERYTAPRYNQDGSRVVAVVAIERCLECGNATYNGQPG